MVRRRLVFWNTFLSLVVVTTCVNGDLIDTSGSYDIIGTNFPVDFFETVGLDGTVKSLADGRLEVFEVITPDGPNSEWIEFVFSTPNGSPLADDIGAFWRIDLLDVPLTEPVLVDVAFVYWTVNGQAVDPIFPFANDAFSTVNPNPFNPSIGPVFGGPLDSPSDPTSSFNPTFL